MASAPDNVHYQTMVLMGSNVGLWAYSVVKCVLQKNGVTLIRQRTRLNKNESFHPEVRLDKYVLAPAK